MFNSQKINNDPRPYIITFDPDDITGDEEFRYEPREEYDNNPNEVLLNFRAQERKYPECWGLENARSWAYMVRSDLSWPNEGRSYRWDHLEHALRVFEKLIVLRGE